MLKKNSLYISLDDFDFDLGKTINEFSLSGGEFLYLDEIHKYPNISAILKTSYDNYKDLHIIASGSSALQILKSSHDLSRRAMIYTMYSMSFREFLALKYGLKFSVYDLDEITKNHTQIAEDIISNLRDIKIMSVFKEYLKSRYFPFSLDIGNEKIYFSLLKQNIEASIDSDLLSIYPNLTGQISHKLKILPKATSQAVPYMPNYTSLKNHRNKR